ncbi:MAG: hypothetical protein JXB26_16965 [Candidatus Aminicenantes bacterium]|nr:hypothetical protein [Candidatus Aminicenantes bacterium]
MEFFRFDVIDSIMVDIYKQKTPMERLKIAFGFWNSVRKQLYFNLHSMNPDWDEKKIHREIAKRLSHGAV